MIVIIDSSTLVAASILWTFESEHGKYKLKAKSHGESAALLEFLNSHKEIKCIITKTVEIESKNVLRKSVENTLENYIDGRKLPNQITSKYSLMTLQDILTNASIDRMEKIIEEYSTRLPINISERDLIKEKEIIPFFDELIPKTNPFFPAPHIPKIIKGSRSGQEDILRAMAESLPKDRIIYYKGYPEPKDLTIMSEAVLMRRKYCKDAELVYVASLDKHFKPNPKTVGNPLWPLREPVGNKEIDSTVRDMIQKRFGFKGEHPRQLLEALSNPQNMENQKIDLR